MPSNQASWIDGQGQKLRVGPSEMYKAGSGEIVVRNHAVTINPVDWKVQEWGVMVTNWPMILGSDLAGEVVEVGDGVTRFKPGDRVVAHGRSLAAGSSRFGAHQQYTVALANTAAILPPNISYNAGCVLPIAFQTAAIGLFLPGGSLGLTMPSASTAAAPSGKTIVVWGGSSSVGSQAIQLATAAGAKVVAVTSARNFDFVRGCGAVDAVDYRSESVVDDIMAAVEKAGGQFAGVYDCISEAESFAPVMQIMQRFGGGNVSVTSPMLPEAPEGVTKHFVFGVNDMTHQLWEGYVTQALESGKLRCTPDALVIGKGLEKLQEGLDRCKAGVSAKKLVVELA